LIVGGWESRELYVFDLPAIRAGLAELGLDWDALPYPPTTLPKYPPQLQITFDMGPLLLDEQSEEAVIKYSLALAVVPLNPVAYLRRGHAYYDLKQWQQAADDLGLALALDSNNRDHLAWLELATACHNSQRLDEAVAAYSRILESGEGDAQVYNQRSVAYNGLGLVDKALADLDKALSLQPNEPIVKNNLAWMLANCPDAKRRDPARAVELAAQAVAALPSDGTLRSTLGLAQYRAGDWNAARDTLQKSLELGQGGGSPFWFGRTTLFLATSHWQLGEKEKARTSYQQAIEWMEKKQPELVKDSGRWNELRRFRAETESVMEQLPAEPKK
jgi:tetratricopeptide (TPR) repeat protein